jgi:hypothetical protein
MTPPPPHSSNIGVVGLNFTLGMNVCVRIFRCVVLYVGSGLATGRSSIQRALIDCLCDLKLKTRPRPNERTVSHYSFQYKLLVSLFQDTVSHIIWHRMTEWTVCDEMERVEEETVVA